MLTNYDKPGAKAKLPGITVNLLTCILNLLHLSPRTALSLDPQLLKVSLQVGYLLY